MADERGNHKDMPAFIDPGLLSKNKQPPASDSQDGSWILPDTFSSVPLDNSDFIFNSTNLSVDGGVVSKPVLQHHASPASQYGEGSLSQSHNSFSWDEDTSSNLYSTGLSEDQRFSDSSEPPDRIPYDQPLDMGQVSEPVHHSCTAGSQGGPAVANKIDQASTPQAATKVERESLSTDAPTSRACLSLLDKTGGSMPSEERMVHLGLAFDVSQDAIRAWFRGHVKQSKKREAARLVAKDSKKHPVSTYHPNTEKQKRRAHKTSRKAWDKSRPFPCTIQCGCENFADKAGWKRHEELHFPQRFWLCPDRACQKRLANNGKFTREERMKSHLSKFHAGSHGPISSYENVVGSDFDRICNFRNCSRSFSSWKDRLNHLEIHFKSSWDNSQWKISKNPAQSEELAQPVEPYSGIFNTDLADPNLLENFNFEQFLAEDNSYDLFDEVSECALEIGPEDSPEHKASEDAEACAEQLNLPMIGYTFKRFSSSQKLSLDAGSSTECSALACMAPSSPPAVEADAEGYDNHLSSVNSFSAPATSGQMSIQPEVEASQPPKLQCWQHGCNGRQFSTFSNLLRHEREKSVIPAKSVCYRCGAEFTGRTARDVHETKCTGDTAASVSTFGPKSLFSENGAWSAPDSFAVKKIRTNTFTNYFSPASNQTEIWPELEVAEPEEPEAEEAEFDQAEECSIPEVAELEKLEFAPPMSRQCRRGSTPSSGDEQPARVRKRRRPPPTQYSKEDVQPVAEAPRIHRSCAIDSDYAAARHMPGHSIFDLDVEAELDIDADLLGGLSLGEGMEEGISQDRETTATGAIPRPKGGERVTGSKGGDGEGNSSDPPPPIPLPKD